MDKRLEWGYLLAAALFLYGLKQLTRPETARRGNAVSALGMLVAIGVTLWGHNILSLSHVGLCLVLGTVVGVGMAHWISMTAMPEMVALLNGFGGLASALVAWTEHLREPGQAAWVGAVTLISIGVGSVTFSGSLMAVGKLRDVLSGRPIRYPGQRLLHGALLFAALACGLLYLLRIQSLGGSLLGFALLALAMGGLMVLPIGGADMPVVVAFLNSCSGLAACATGFVLENQILIVAGALVGSSGLILTRQMCRAMNRSLGQVLFGGFGVATTRAAALAEEVHSISTEEAATILASARRVVIVPGYGLGVAQAQHVLHNLANRLEANGAEICYAIHPVAGRMPGHMNVLLAEAQVPYEQLVEAEKANPLLSETDVCLVIGANDVVNPAARDDPSSPLYGMPIVEADRARLVVVLKRSLAPGFAGIENRLFSKEQTRMLFGDARASLQALIAILDQQG